ncbi:ORF6N domain-containing protein [Clostridium botulinum]|nr:ORF6N domain-containing protein [Clostridium botulinum]MBY6851750.1 ORF6N domain-containing protein [Clostridium botulinum]
MLLNKLIPLEFNKQRIMTTKVLAEEFGTEDRRITENFSRNEERFKKGKHYILLQGEELREFKRNYAESVSANINKLYLWTDRGAARHAKILDTDEAWNVYEELEENYFNPNKNIQALNTSELSPELQMFNKMFQAVANVELSNKELKNELEDVKKSNEEAKNQIQGIRDVVAINTSTISWREDCRRIVVKIAHKLGGNNFIGDVNREIYGLMRIRLKVKLDVKLTNMRRRMADEGVCVSKRNQANYLDVIEKESRLVEGYVAIVKELAIKYGVDKKNVV